MVRCFQRILLSQFYITTEIVNRWLLFFNVMLIGIYDVCPLVILHAWILDSSYLRTPSNSVSIASGTIGHCWRKIQRECIILLYITQLQIFSVQSAFYLFLVKQTIFYFPCVCCMHGFIYLRTPSSGSLLKK